jgi:hypothetical protein
VCVFVATTINKCHSVLVFQADIFDYTIYIPVSNPVDHPENSIK